MGAENLRTGEPNGASELTTKLRNGREIVRDHVMGYSGSQLQDRFRNVLGDDFFGMEQEGHLVHWQRESQVDEYRERLHGLPNFYSEWIKNNEGRPIHRKIVTGEGDKTKPKYDHAGFILSVPVEKNVPQPPRQFLVVTGKLKDSKVFVIERDPEDKSDKYYKNFIQTPLPMIIENSPDKPIEYDLKERGARIALSTDNVLDLEELDGIASKTMGALFQRRAKNVVMPAVEEVAEVLSGLQGEIAFIEEFGLRDPQIGE